MLDSDYGKWGREDEWRRTNPKPSNTASTIPAVRAEQLS